jgi:aspartyl/asparaginyl-tRNA synthetase
MDKNEFSVRGILAGQDLRTLAYLTGLANVRDAIPCPRTCGNARY